MAQLHMHGGKQVAGSQIDIKELRCDSLIEKLGPAAGINRLSGWAQGIEVFSAKNVLYLPRFSLQVCRGIVPLEGILHPPHLGWMQRHIKPEEAIVELEGLERSDEDVCILGNLASRNFGHWTEELLKVLILEQSGFSGKYVITPTHSKFANESLSALGVLDSRVLAPAAPIIYARAHYGTPVSHWTAVKHAHVLFRLREVLHAQAAQVAGLGPRLWSDRGPTARGRRGIINREEIDRCLQKHGFQCVDFGELAFVEQIAAARDMHVLCGPHGSAFVQCQFMHDRREVIEVFSPEFVNPSVIRLCRAYQHRYSQIVPAHRDGWRYQYGLDLEIDIDHLDLVLSSLLPWPTSWGG